MRRTVLIAPATVATALAFFGGCASNERTVYVPATTSGAIAAGDPLGMQMMHKAGVIGSAAAQPVVPPVAHDTFTQASNAPVVAAAQGGFVTMMSSYPSYGRLRDSDVRMPIVTFAATDGPSAD